MGFLSELPLSPGYLETPNARRAYALNTGFRRLADALSSPGNYAVWLMSRAEEFVRKPDYPLIVCPCMHPEILEEARFRGAPVYFCLDCRHLVRFSFAGNPVHCEGG